MPYRKFSLSEKQEILRESNELGVIPAARKFNVSQSLIYKWRDKAESGTLRETGQSFAPDPSQAIIAKLEKELSEYKMIVAERDLEIRVKDAIIKKVQQREQKS